MTFTQIPDSWADSPEVLSVSRSARLLEVEGKGYCNRHLTDGLITRGQWLRATDSETFDDDLTELIDARLVTVAGPNQYQLDWEHQQTREQVEKARARRRADNDRRAKSLELHKEGDHSLCTHAGGGRARQTGETVHETSTGRSTGTSTSKSTGRSKDNKNGRSIGASRGRSEVGSPNPPQPSPTQPIVERRVGGDGLAPDGSAGATPSGAGALPVAAETPQRPAVVTLADLPEAFATLGLEEHELASAWENLYADPESALYGTWSPRPVADPADGLDGLIPAGGADGAGR